MAANLEDESVYVIQATVVCDLSSIVKLCGWIMKLKSEASSNQTFVSLCQNFEYKDGE